MKRDKEEILIKTAKEYFNSAEDELKNKDAIQQSFYISNP